MKSVESVFDQSTASGAGAHADANTNSAAKATSASSVQAIENVDRKRCLDMRGRVVLNDDGSKFFKSRSAPLSIFESPEGDPRYGFRLKSVDVPWLKRLLLSGFVDKAEFPVRDISSVKNELGDLSRLVVFSMLFGCFRSSIIARVVDTDVIRRWNRMHPHQSLDAKNAVSPAELKVALASRAESIEELKQEILQPVLRSITTSQKRSPEDIRRINYFVRDLLNNLDPLVYFVLLGSAPEARRALQIDIGRQLLSSVAKIDLADYLTLMVLELMSAAERTTLIELLGSDVPPSQVRAQLENPEKRMALLSRLPNGLASAMVWSLARRWSLGRWRYRLRLGLFDGSSSYEDSRRLFEERGRLSVSDRSLKEFYEQGTGPYGDDGMGWYYLSFMAEACQKMNINFEASVRERPGHGTTAVNLVFIF
jgi:hypothetical protein